jgi:hypothetical protein
VKEKTMKFKAADGRIAHVGSLAAAPYGCIGGASQFLVVFEDGRALTLENATKVALLLEPVDDQAQMWIRKLVQKDEEALRRAEAAYNAATLGSREG